ncbi:MAG TPA: heparinase II/III family protein [Anaerolineaceae bacterium]
MNVIDLQRLLDIQAPEVRLVEQIRKSPTSQKLLEYLRKVIPDLSSIPQTTYTLYREFEKNGERDGFQKVYFAKRSMLTRAVFEVIMGNLEYLDTVHDLLWSICEETTWVLPAHEEQGPDYWDIHPPVVRTEPLGSHTMLTRQPDSIDLFAAETGASLAETLYMIGDLLAPEVVEKVRQEVQRHIFLPYLANARKHWWYKGALNWNGVVNGSVGLAFMRLEKDRRTLAEAISLVLEGFQAYIDTGFEADGGSIEGIGYWNYGLMYYVTLSELLRERTAGKIDLLANPKMKAIARYPLAVALSKGLYVAFGDANERLGLQPGIVSKLVERTGVNDLLGLLVSIDELEGMGVGAAKLAIVMRDAIWWDGKNHPFPETVYQDHYLPECAVIKVVAKTLSGKPTALVAKAGHNDGHHSHTDVGNFVYYLGEESLVTDPGRGHYNKEYFRQSRYKLIFNNGLGHNLPVIGGKMEEPGPEFGGTKQYHGEIIAHSDLDHKKTIVIDFQNAYNLPELKLARRNLTLDAATGELILTDQFLFGGNTLTIEEGFVSWFDIKIDEQQPGRAIIQGKQHAIELSILEPAGASFSLKVFEEESKAGRYNQVLKRLVTLLPAGSVKFIMQIKPYGDNL